MLSLLKLLQKYIKEFYFVGLAMVEVGLPFSRLILSIGMFWLAGCWIVEGQYLRKLKAFANNRIALLFASIFALHLVGLIFTSDFNYAFKDIRIKLPLFLVPFIFSGMPKLSTKQIRTLLIIFVLAVLLSTLFDFLIYLEVILPGRIAADVRYMSYFISHIRLGLMVSFSIMILGYLFYKGSNRMKAISGILILWFLVFLYILESFTGYTTLIAGVLILLIIYIFRLKTRKHRVLVVVVTLVISGGTFLYVKSCVDDYYTIREDTTVLDTYTPYGGEYFHNLDNDQIENGYYIYRHLAVQELVAAWKAVSDYAIDGKDDLGQPIYGTLIRYLTSKGLRKDKDGVDSLSEQDIKNIESGIANITYLESGIRKRIHQVLFELDAYRNHGDPTGNSYTQRMEYWKNGWYIATNNLAVGVGTGDVQNAFDEAYRINNTPMEKESWKRGHNQFLTMLITFGVVGLIWFVFCLFYPIFKYGTLVNYTFLAFFVIAMLSFLWEDTLETQIGVSFFAFFYGLFLLASKQSEAAVRGVNHS